MMMPGIAFCRWPRARTSAICVVVTGSLLLAACDGGAATTPEDAAGAALAPAATPALGTVRVQDVVLVTIDTLRADATGFAGNPRAQTPVLDALAASGRVFTNAHAHNVVTLPSHTNILTGRLPYEHGVRDNTGFVLGDTLPTAATLFSAAGFATGAFVAAFPLDARFGLGRGFDVYDDQLPLSDGAVRFASTERPGDQVVARALAWWQRERGKRRFLWIHLFEPHAPYAPPEPFASRFAADPYLGEVAATDAYLAPLLQPFLDGGEPAALIAVTADHGESLGEHGERTHGLFAYEATLRVPLVLSAPGLAAATVDQPARHIDLLPTLLEAAGVEVPADLPGRSLLGDPPATRTTTYFEALTATFDRGWAPLRGLIEGGEKAIELPIPELYDLAADPHEANNLATHERRRLAALREQLPAESAWPPPRKVEGSAEERAALRSLGYTAGAGAGAKARYGIEDDPKNLIAIDQAVHRFIDLFQQRRLTAATDVAREVVATRPDMPLGYENLAQVLLERAMPEAALEVMQRAHQRGLAAPSLIRQLALTLSQLGRAGEAVDLLWPARDSHDPDDLDVLGVALSEAGRQADAKAVLERVFRFDPSHPEAYQHLALVALRSKDYAAAAAAAERALAGSDRLHHAWNYLGVARVNLGKKREALDAWERAIALAPGDLDLLYNVAVVALEIGDRARARSALEAFIASAPRDRHAADIARAQDLLRQLGAAP